MPSPASHSELQIAQTAEWRVLPEHIGSYPPLTPRIAGYIVSGTAIVDRGYTLTVRAGANIEFLPASNRKPGELWIKGGKLDVEGSAAFPAVFTSPHDDAAGGNCECDPPGNPQPGDWYGVALVEGGSASISHGEFRYA